MLTDTEYKLRLGEIQYGRSKAGSRNNFTRITDRNVISKANTCFKGRQHNGTLTDTAYKLHLGEIPNDQLETGSSIDFVCNMGRNAISKANTMISRVANTTEC
jgi:hypothetical protein